MDVKNLKNVYYLIILLLLFIYIGYMVREINEKEIQINSCEEKLSQIKNISLTLESNFESYQTQCTTKYSELFILYNECKTNICSPKYCECVEQ
jgi:hypothetical protein